MLGFMQQINTMGLGLTGKISSAFTYLKSLFSGFQGTETITSGALVVPDYTGTLQSVPADIIAVTGARWATTVADGAELGPDIYAGTFVLDVNITETGGTFTCNVSGTNTAHNWIRFNIIGGVSTTSYQMQFKVITEGNFRYFNGSSYVDLGILPPGTYSFPSYSHFSQSYFLMTVAGSQISDFHIEKVIPKFLDTLTDGTPLQPSKTLNAKKIPLYYPPVERSTAYAVGDKRSTVASDGIERYYTAQTAGTTDATAPTFATSGDTIDGGVTWAYQGYHTIKGVDVWPVRTNSFLNSNAPVTQDITTAAPDYTINVLGTGDITVSGSATGTATEGSPLTVSAAAGTLTCTVNGTVTRAQVEDGSFATPWIDTTTATVTRASTDITLPTAGVLPVNDFGIMGMVNPGASGQGSNAAAVATYLNGTNWLIIIPRAAGNSVILQKYLNASFFEVSAPFTYSIDVPFTYQAYQSATYGMGIRVYNTTMRTWSAWAERNDADGRLDAPIASTYQIGARNNTSHFAGNYPDTMIIQSSDPKADLIRLATQLGY